ncbi:hypothetical protein [Thalassobacillus sp. CUG 92003]|uniref:hypothetical protein n=1 Tax=Thalassobacillus sp. CUG 92003 TaxID=2736641 RepID=UPI0015E7C227|nr:hypothetical protein [Thalassobacillus sp. CUG 92003]
MAHIMGKTQFLSAFLFTFLQSFMNTVEEKVTQGEQKNALAVWITVSIIVLVGGLTLAGLMWACSHFVDGTFEGSFEILGAKVRIKCGT